MYIYIYISANLTRAACPETIFALLSVIIPYDACSCSTSRASLTALREHILKAVRVAELDIHFKWSLGLDPFRQEWYIPVLRAVAICCSY